MLTKIANFFDTSRIRISYVLYFFYNKDLYFILIVYLLYDNRKFYSILWFRFLSIILLCLIIETKDFQYFKNMQENRLWPEYECWIPMSWLRKQVLFVSTRFDNRSILRKIYRRKVKKSRIKILLIAKLDFRICN